MIKIRPANNSDIEWLFLQCEDFAAFYNSKISLAGNPEYGKLFLKDLVEKHFVRISLKDDHRVGFIAGMIGPHHFNPDIRQLTELLWWVQPEARNSGAGAALFKDFVKFGETECDWVTFTLEHNSPVNDNFLLKRGFKITEKAYLKEC